jgi:hypothetical protein
VAARGAGGDITVRVPVILDGRQITEVVADRVKSRNARK